MYCSILVLAYDLSSSYTLLNDMIVTFLHIIMSSKLLNVYTPQFTILMLVGIYCQIDINDCEKSVCQNSGTCIDRVNSYECECAPHYTGAHCELVTNICDEIICANGGVCYSTSATSDGFMCLCANGYSGKYVYALVTMSIE